MKDVMAKVDLFPFATASRAGVPNVVPVRYLLVEDDDTLWITDNFFLKTLVNLAENPQIALYVYEPDSGMCFQIKGQAEVKTSGADYERMRDTVRKKKADLPARSLVVVRIAEIFECRPGPDAGKKLF
jgi:predicted pyridoxine 5'-phosphate oxidase superfamily flavin-nucleotide-binding protein